ncbi:MAG: hypothetical protein WCB44_23010, partial [Stellaceae bacterium]
LTSAASCGLIQAGGEAGLTLRRVESVSVGFVRADFVIETMYQKFALCRSVKQGAPPMRIYVRRGERVIDNRAQTTA